MEWKQATDYQILHTRDNKLMFVIPASKENKKPQTPHLIYDGKDHALLYKDEKQGVVLDYIAKQCSKELLNATDVFICEYDIANKKVQNTYVANVNKVKRLNVKLFKDKKQNDR